MEHDCSILRSIGYYLESLLCLAPFMKHPLRIVLRGVTNDQVDPSVSNEAIPRCEFYLSLVTTQHLRNQFLITHRCIVESVCFVIYLEI